VDPEQIIDSQALAKLLETVGGDEGFLTELIEAFLEEAPGLLDEMDKAVLDSDAERLRLHAHTLKSNAAQFGATQLSAICLAIEQQAKEQALDGVDLLAAQARTELQKVREALQSGGAV
jgi:HPt (histidine-containing phosphotransfer) domain-containing protein